MKKFILLFLLYFLPKAQTITTQTLLNDKISIRAIQIWDNKVWYTGTDSKFGYVSLKDTLDKKQFRLSDKKLQFRTLAQSKKYFFAANIESPAYFFRMNKKDLKPEIIYTDDNPKAFYDALIFSKDGKGMALGDPYERCMTILSTTNNGKKWKKISCNDTTKVVDGEAAFAASNSNIFLNQDKLGFITGGIQSKIYRGTSYENISSEILPMIGGKNSTGAYSIDMDPKSGFGIVVGGDYTRQNENIDNIATSNDWGKTWHIQASGKNSGYRTCVKIKPNTQGKEIISVGDQDISYSFDFGKTWKIISSEKGLYVCQWLNDTEVILAGKNKIIKLSFLY